MNILCIPLTEIVHTKIFDTVKYRQKYLDIISR